MLKISKCRGLLIFMASIIIIVLALGAYMYNLMFSPNFNLSKNSYVYIYPETSFDGLCEQLQDSLDCKNIVTFKRLAKYMNYPKHMRTGRYKVDTNMDNYMLLNNLIKGKQEPVRFTFNNMRLKEDLADRVGEQLMLSADSLKVLFNDSIYCDSLGFTPQTIAAMFIPNTYEFYWNIKMDDFMKRMKKEYDKFWNAERTAKAKDIGFTPVEISTIASIVEEESAKSDEYPMIAGLYINRLHTGMPLQADPSIKFAVGDFSIKRILHAHLEIDSPYNTYKYAGLPPGPIRIPSIKGINSVLNYTHHDYLYMCAKEDFSGRHNFASTLEQHAINANRYRRALDRAGIY